MSVKTELRDILNRIVTRQLLMEAGHMAVALITERTAQGKGLDGRFAPYSTAYADRKFGHRRTLLGIARRARSSKGRQRAYTGLIRRLGEKVDLTLTGRMLRDMKVVVGRDTTQAVYTVTVGYIEGRSSRESIEKAGYHNNTGAGASRVKRRFVGLTAAEQSKMLSWFNKKM